MREDIRAAFETIDWSNGRKEVPRSGNGSTMAATDAIRSALPRIFKDYNVQTFLDAPCGDWFWMRHVDLSEITYIGADISTQLVSEHKKNLEDSTKTFIHLDVTSDVLPQVDMMMCRDCLFHLQFKFRWAFYQNFVTSKIPYLLSTINHNSQNIDVKRNGGWQPYNPMLAPFFLPAPLEMVHETQTNLPNDWWEIQKIGVRQKNKSMGIWSRHQILETIRSAQAHGRFPVEST